MKTPFTLLMAIVVVCGADAADPTVGGKHATRKVPGTASFKKPDSWPIMVIESVVVPTTPNSPLEIVFTLKASKTSPVAVAQSSFGVVISDKSHPWLFVATPNFPSEKEKVLIAQPGHPIHLKATALADNHDQKKTWYSLPAGEHEMRIYAWGGKSLEFDYQWLGQTYSDDYRLMIGKNAEQPGADQPATKAADKVPAKVQPPTPTSKDAPR